MQEKVVNTLLLCILLGTLTVCTFLIHMARVLLSACQ